MMLRKSLSNPVQKTRRLMYFHALNITVSDCHIKFYANDHHTIEYLETEGVRWSVVASRKGLYLIMFWGIMRGEVSRNINLYCYIFNERRLVQWLAHNFWYAFNMITIPVFYDHITLFITPIKRITCAMYTIHLFI